MLYYYSRIEGIDNMQASKKNYSVTNFINSYLKEFEKLTEAETNSNIEIIKKKLETMPITDLMHLYIIYTTSKYDTKALLNCISSLIISKLDTLSLIKTIDLYTIIFNQILLVEDSLMAEKNILSVMSFELSNEEFIEKEI